MGVRGSDPPDVHRDAKHPSGRCAANGDRPPGCAQKGRTPGPRFYSVCTTRAVFCFVGMLRIRNECRRQKIEDGRKDLSADYGDYTDLNNVKRILENGRVTVVSRFCLALSGLN